MVETNADEAEYEASRGAAGVFFCGKRSYTKDTQ